MTESAKLRIPYIAASQAQKHVTHNEGMTLLDTLVQLSVLDRDLNGPPVDPYEAYGYRPRRYRGDLVVVREEDLEDEDERPRRRRGSSRGRAWREERDEGAEEVTAASLQSRADALREELQRIEDDLKKLAAAPTGAPRT